MLTRRAGIPFEFVLVPCLLLAAVAAHGTNRGLEARRVERAADGTVGVLPDGATVRTLSLGFERLAADLFWIRTAYYVGGEDAMKADYPDAERLANLVTDIDPQFDSAYVVMASVLNGLRKDPDAAIRLLEKGAAVSKYWRIHFLLGFQYFMEKQDYLRGAHCLERASELGGPEYLTYLTSRLYAHAGDPTTAMQFISARLRQEENPEVRARLEQRLSDIWITRDLDLIDAAIAKYREQTRRDPKDVRALVDAKLLPELPHDPKGGSYGISDGRATTQIPYELMRLKEQRH